MKNGRNYIASGKIVSNQQVFDQQYLNSPLSQSILNGETISQSSFITQHTNNNSIIIYIDKKNLKVFDSEIIIPFPDMHITAKESNLITSKYSICEDMSLVYDNLIYAKSKKIFNYNINDDYNIISIYGTSIKPKRIIHNISQVKCLEIKHKIQALDNVLFAESIRF